MRAIQIMSRAVFIAACLTAWATTVRADEKLKLTGCLVKGDRGYLLVNAPAGMPSDGANNTSVSPDSVGVKGTYANVFYWLDNDDKMKPHIGHRVEIEGDAKDTIKDGEIKVDRKDEWTEIEVRSDGQSLKAQVPNASIVPPPDPDRKVEVFVRRVDVDKLRMLSADCR